MTGLLAAQGRLATDLLLAAVDCTLAANEPVCSGEDIVAFPSVRVYREGADTHHGPGERHEAYHGTRDAEAIASFAMQVLAEVGGQQQLPGGAAALPPGAGTDGGGDGKPDSQVLTKGCMVEGHVRVARVPGSITFSPHSEGHSFDAARVNMTHVVRHLSFGRGRDRAPQRSGGGGAAALRRVGSLQLPADLGGAFAMPVVSFPDAPNPHGTRARFETARVLHSSGKDWAQSPAHSIFRSEEDATVHEHYAKVVPVRYVPLRGKPARLYEYTIASNAYQEEVLLLVPQAPSGQQAEGPAQRELVPPEVRLTYDLSPMRVAYLETKQVMRGD